MLRELDKFTVFRLVQLLNAQLSIVSTVSGMVISERPVQDSKRCVGIFVIPSSNVTFVRLEQDANGA